MTATSTGQGAAPQMTFTLPPLPYAFDALEPYIDAKTMEIHHDKHHGTYVTNLNKALEGHADLQKLSIEELLAQINKVPEAISSFADFKAKINDAATKRFGSGWAWLMFRDGKLVIESTANQDNPVMDGGKAFFGVDVWEHAYYLKYQNRRPEYLEAWWNTINWAQVEENFAHAKK
jgi:superoxide dismutase, Fe-Mn family